MKVVPCTRTSKSETEQLEQNGVSLVDSTVLPALRTAVLAMDALRSVLSVFNCVQCSRGAQVDLGASF